MRIKVSNDSVPNGGFWYAIDDNSNATSTISDLQRDLNNILHLSKNPSRISLSLDNFGLLPQSPISGLIRDGDLIQVQHVGKKQTAPKHKSSKSKAKTKPDTPTDKQKKRKRSTEDTKPQRQQKRQKKVAPKPISTESAPLSKSKKRNERRSLARIARRQQKLANKTEQQQHQQQHQQQQQQQQQPATTAAQPSMLDQPVEPRHLIKKNKNKSKHFLKKMDKSTRSHVVFDKDDSMAFQEQQQQCGDYDGYDGTQPAKAEPTDLKNVCGGDYDGYDDTQPAKAEPDDLMNVFGGDYDGYDDTQPAKQEPVDLINVFGGAFITDSESQRYGNKGRAKKNQQNYMNRQYPVDEADAVFYATVEPEDIKSKVEEDLGDKTSSDSSDSSDSDSSDSDSSDDDSSDNDSSDDDDDDDDESSAKEDKVDELPVVVDYDKCPAISFQGPSPPHVGDHLAIKTLHLSETYTPEISDWKEVKVLELTGQDIVVERVGPMKRSITKTLRKFDLPPEHESIQADDLTETHNYNDVFDMRRLVD